MSSGGNLEVPCRASRGDTTRQRTLDRVPMLDLVTWGRSGKLTRLVPGEVSAEFWDVGRLDGASQDYMTKIFFNRSIPVYA